MDDYRQIIVLRKDLNMRKGKMVAQGAHASMATILDKGRNHWLRKVLKFFGFNILVLDLKDNSMGPWLTGKFKKITVSVNSEAELFAIHKKAQEAGLMTSLILDSGLTEFKEPTYTAVAIGPDLTSKISQITGDLPLL